MEKATVPNAPLLCPVTISPTVNVKAGETLAENKQLKVFAEYGVAAHWRYKEGAGASSDQKYDEKIAWLRQLLAWKSEVVDAVVGQDDTERQWVEIGRAHV